MPNDPHNCLHRNIHWGRIDANRTVCFDCEHMVIVTCTQYADGKTADVQFKEMLAKLNQQKHDELGTVLERAHKRQRGIE